MVAPSPLVIRGASGARILMTLIYELRRRGGGIGVASICGGLAQGWRRGTG
jgi:acetyl-CoA acetyltransferase